MTASTYSNTRANLSHSQRHRATHITIENLQKFAKKLPQKAFKSPKLWQIEAHFGRSTKNNKNSATRCVTEFYYLHSVGMTRFELATTRPPDEYSKPD